MASMKKKRTFIASTDTPILRHGWGESYLETLNHDDGAIDLSRFADEKGRFHLSHDWESPVGVITRAWIGKDPEGRKALMLEAEFDDELEEGKRVLDRIESGLYDRVSIGWDYDDRDVEVRRSEFRDTGAEYEVYFRAWIPTECSFVSVPADINAGLRAGTAAGNRHIERNKRIQSLLQQRRAQPMPEANPNPTPTPDTPPVRNAAYDVFRGQRSALRQAGFTDDQINAEMDAAVTGNETAEQAQQRVLGMLSNGPATPPTPDNPEPTARTAYQVWQDSRAALRNVGRTQEAIDDAMDASMEAGDGEREAMKRVMDMLAEGNPALANPQRAPHVGNSDTDQYSLARAVQLKSQGRLYDNEGRGSLESELHFEARRARDENPLIPSVQADELAMPMRLLMRDNMVRSAVARNARSTGLQRALDSADNAGILTESFNEMDLIEELYSRSGLLPHVATFPTLLNQNLKVPKEDNRFAYGWNDEDGARSATSTPDYADTLEWSWKETSAQFNITRQLIDQTTYLYDRLMQMVREDLPRQINNALWNGTGANNQPTGILVASGIGDVTNTNGTVLTWDILNSMVTKVQAANAHYIGDGMFFSHANVLGKLRATERAAGTNGQFIIPVTDPADRPTIMGMQAQLDNMIAAGRTKGTANSTVSTMVYGIPKTVKIGYFSDMSLIVDPYTRKNNGEISIQLRQALDFQILYTQAWQKVSDANYA